MCTWNRLLLGASLGLLLACGDPTGAAPDANAAGAVPPGTGLPSGTGAPEPIRLRPGAPALATTHASFWAVQGQRSGVIIEYRARPDGAAPGEFLRFTVPAHAQIVTPTGQPLARGDSILIEVSVIPGHLAARFSPEGLTFTGKASAQLAIDYMQGDVPVDPARQLGIWYVPCDGGAWEAQRSRIDRKRSMVVGSISHFSNYAVAY